MSGWAFSSVVNSIREEESPKRLIEFLDQELARTTGQGKRQSSFNISSRYYGHNQSATISLPSYPPKQLIAFPDAVYLQLQMPEGSDDDAGMAYSTHVNQRSDGKDDVLPPSEIALAVNTAKDPTMKVLLELKYFFLRHQEAKQQKNETSKTVVPLPDEIKAAFGEQVTNEKSAIDQLFTVSKTNVDAWYLTGCLAVQDQRWDDAAASFETMRSLPMTAKHRRTIDEHLVALATHGLVGDLKNEKYKKVLMSAKSAALRLRRGQLTHQQRLALISAFETLELNDEAEKMESRIANAANTGTSRSSSGSPVASAERITKLNEAGKTDAAARLLAQEFQGLARDRLALGSTNNNSKYYLEEFTQKIRKLGFEKELFRKIGSRRGSQRTQARSLGIRE